MIRLEVEKYCENCGEFKPCITVEESWAVGHKHVFNTVVTCKQSERCCALMEHLKRCDAE